MENRPTIPIIDNSIVQIGTQVSMTKNLNVSRYRNGDPIPQVTNSTQWRNLTTGAWCYYNNDPANGPIYGKLYNWQAVNDPRGLAPTGYHVPSEAEFTTLTNFLGGQSVAGGKMKAVTLWNNPNTGATNSSGFTGLPGGFRYLDGTFAYIRYDGCWWSSTYLGNPTARYCYLGSSIRDVQLPNGFTKYGYSVRCLKD